MKMIICKISIKALLGTLGMIMLLSACSRDFLNPEPLSFYEPNATFSTESGLMSAMAICDRHLKLYYVSDHNEMEKMGTEYMFSDLMVASATDKTSMLDNVAEMLTPVSENGGLNLGRNNSIDYYWGETYNGIKYANTILYYVDDIEGMSDELKNEYKGRAYFHRAFRYYNLVFQYNDVPLVANLTTKPKFDYKSTSKEAILDMLIHDLEFSVEHVPNQEDMDYVGMINKGACRMLLSKCYMATGQFQKAKDLLDVIIDQSGYALLTGNQFGSFDEGGESATWTITRNIIWDMHRGENKLLNSNTELILGAPNRGASAEAFTPTSTMRIFYPFAQNSAVKVIADGRDAFSNIPTGNSNYDKTLDNQRAFGRGIATYRPTPFQQFGLWAVNGVMDETDLRHSHEMGNWVRMEDYKINNPSSSHRGENFSKATVSCSDSIRRWFDVPHYKFYYYDPIADNDPNSNGFRGAKDGGNADMYIYRLAEAYLLRAEAKYYLGDATAVNDVNIIRQRANCTEMYSTVDIDDIADERARELYYEEWRNVELTRMSLCLALSGKPDKAGNVYDPETFDKQTGTDLAGGSFWYQRVIKGGMYNTTPTINVEAANSAILYKMDKKNIYWPIPNDAITANNKGVLKQNYGYDGYNPNTEVWDNWEDASADEL